MAVTIQVEQEKEGKFRVRIKEGDSSTTHAVTVQPDYYQKLARGRVSEAELVRRSFEFLLEREPKEAILGAFDLAAITRYFPEYEREMARRLGG